MANSPTDLGAVEARAAGKKSGSTDRLKLSNYLGILRDDPEDANAHEALKTLAIQRDTARLGEQPVRLLEAARQAHEAKAELSAVAKLIEIEAMLVDDDPGFAANLWKELGRLRADELLDPDGARAAYDKAFEISPDDAEVDEAVKRLEQSERSWRKFAKRFVEEAEGASDVALKTSLLVRAAALVWQYKKKNREDETDELFQRALKVDPGNRRAVLLYEHTLRERKAWEPLAELLLDAAGNAREKADRVNFHVRSGRVFAQRLRDNERAAACYERVLDLESSNPESMSFLSEHYAKQERWDDLVAMYEQALSVRQKLEVEQGILLQIGMVHWRMRKKPADAEPVFARLRKLNPAHPSVLDFYRDYHQGSDRIEQWLAVLGDAQRVATEDSVKLDLALQVARVAQMHPPLKDRAIEAWKLVQRLDPTNREALHELKALYLRAEKWNALADVIKAEIDATPDATSEQIDKKVGLLRELLAIYRDRLHMDGMVIGTLGRIVKLTPGDREALTELATKYESAGRYNDLINVLSERADALKDRPEKVDAYLRVARLWIERFANYSQATTPLEKVLQLDPDNREALSQLKEIYEKKRAWKQLYEVLRKEKSVASDPSVRLANTIEMAKLAADRLQGYAEAIALWKEALSLDANAPGAIEALEKLSEGEKDYATLVEVLETELKQASSAEVQIRILQKLALLHGEKLSHPEDGMRCWRRILEIEPKHGRALRAVRDSLLKARDWDGLEALYVGVRDFEGLVDVLSHEADNTDEAKLKVDLSFRTARVFEERTGDGSRAVRSYERVLSVEPKNARAAAALAKLYEHDSKWTRLRAMLDVLLQGASDKAERLALLQRLRELCLTQLRDGEAAFGYAAQAYALAPESDTVRAALEGAAEAAVAYDRVLELYLARAEHAPPDETNTLRRRCAALGMERLSKPEVSVEQLRRVLAAQPKDTEVMATLERLFRAGQRTKDLHALLVHRLEHTGDPDVRWDALKELAQIEERDLNDARAAAERYRVMSEIDPSDREALLARDRLALAAERWDELATVLQRRLEIEKDGPAVIELNARLGALQLDRRQEPEDALSAFEQVLAQDRQHASTVAALERIAEQHPALSPRVGRTLEDVYEQSGRYDKLLKVLSQRLENEKNDEEIRRLRLRLAEISGSKLGDAVGAYASLEAAFFEKPDDRELWDRLAEVADKAGQQRALAAAYARVIEHSALLDDEVIELATRAARIYDDVLGQPEEAEPFHVRILRADSQNDVSFAALKELYTVAERWDELQTLYRKRIADTIDAEAKLDLLLQLCFVFEEILDRPEQAIEAYQQVLQLSPEHGAARRTLEQLYERTERWRDLCELLRGNLDHAEGYERVDLMYRMGELHETRLNEPGQAVDQYEAVLADQPTHLRAQQALSRLLGAPGQRQRIATILEPLYEKQGAYIDLARVLEIQLEGPADSGSAELLMRLGELHDQRTRDQDAAFFAYARAVEADPSSESAREALARVSGTRDAFRRQRAQVLQRALDKTQDKALQGDLLLELAVLLDQYLADKDGAERAYEQLIELDPENADAVLTAARALEAIHVAKNDHARLANDLKRQVDFETEPKRRSSLLVRLGDLCENRLDQLDGAIDAHKKRLEIDAADVDALRALERLYERAERWSDLVEVLRAHADASGDEQERRRLGRRAASLRDERLSDFPGAIEAYKDVLTSFGPDRDTLRALSLLHERTERHADLLETLEAEEALLEDPAERAQLQFRMAELMRLHTAEPTRSLDYYDQVLTFDPAHAGALGALDSLMNDPGSTLRLDAARLAAPRYEASSAFERLLAVLEVQQDTSDVGDKLAALRRAAEVADTGLKDRARAFVYMARAARAGVNEPVLHDLLVDLDRLAESSGRFRDLVALLREIVPEVEGGELKSEVHRRIARTARVRLEDPAIALEHYSKLLEDAPEDAEALDALQALNEQSGDHAALIAVLQRKAELARDKEQRRALLAQQAEIYERHLQQPDAAIDVLQDLIIDSPTESAYASLERLYTAGQRFSDLRGLYEQQLDREIGSPVELRYKLAQIAHLHLQDSDGALSHLRDALTDHNGHEPSIALLESIMSGEGEHRAAAAEILEPLYLARMQWPKLTAALEARIQGEQDVDERKRLLTRLGQIHEDQLEDFDAAIEVYARLFRDDPRDEDTWETLTRLTRISGQWAKLGKILSKPLDDEPAADAATARLAKYAGRLYVERVANHHRSAQLFEQALAFDPTDEEAFVALESAYRHTGSSEKLLQLYRDQADRSDGDERRVKLLHERARIYRDVLDQPAEAIATYREILELVPDNAVAVSGLESLLTQAEDWPALADNLRARIDHAVGKREELPLKLSLAELLETRLNDVTAAIDVYEEVANADPKEARAVAALERLVQDSQYTLRITQVLEPIYRKLDQWKKLVAVLEAQVELQNDDSERVRVLGEVGELHEKRGGDKALALHAWMRAFTRDPGYDEARANVDRLAGEMEAWNEHVQAYEAALAKTEDAALKTSLLTMLARVQDEKRGDPRAAIAVYERLALHEPEDPTPLDSLEALHTMVGDWLGLTRVLNSKIERAYDAQERSELLRRTGSVHEELLSDRGAAIEAYKRAVAEDDADEQAYEALDRLYALERKPEELAKVLSRRIELALDPAARVELGSRLGQLFERLLHQPDQAIDAYRRVLDDDASNLPALHALAALFERQGLWSELLENLSQQQMLAAGGAQRVALLQRAGEVLEQRTGDVDAAIDRYREALEIDSAHAPSIDALLRISRSSEHRARAAEIVEPLLRAHGRFDDLVQLIEGGLASEDDPLQRRAELQRLAELHEHSRARPQDAFDTLCRALAADPADDAVLKELERLAQQLQAYGPLADALAQQAGVTPDGELSANLYRRLARICEEELRDDARAIDAFAAASERDDSPETLVALDRLYLRTQRWDGLLDVLERRIAASADPAERTDLLIRLGELRDERFDDGRGAFVAFKEVLDSDPGEQRALAGMERVGRRDALAHDVLSLLDDCYRQVGSIDKLAGLYDIRIRLAETDAERIRLLNEAARIWESELRDPARALAKVRRVFELDPSDRGALTELERLAEAAGSFEGVRGMVEGLITTAAIEGQQKRTLALRAADWYRDKLNDAAAQERCLRWALEVDAQQAAVHERLIDLLRAPGREADLVTALRAFAEVEADAERRKEHLREAAQIAQSALADTARAADCYEALLEVAPEDRAGLAELTRIRAAQERFADVATLLERRIAVEPDADVRVGLRVQLAQTYEEQLGDAAQAIVAHRGVLDEAPGHVESQAALERLYARAERWDDLRKLLERRVAAAEPGEARAQLRLNLAELAEKRLGDAERAVKELKALLAEQADHVQAQDELERLYRAGQRPSDLVQLLTHRAARAAETGDVETELERLRQAAAVYESELDDAEQAIATYASIHARAPSDRTALEALIRLRTARKQWAEAASAMHALLALLTGEPANALALQLADLAEQSLNDEQLAESALRKVYERDPAHAPTRDRLKKLYEKQNAHAKLVAVLSDEEQRLLDSAERVALLNRIAALYRDKLSDAASAVSYLERAVALQPDDREALLSLCDLYIAASRPRDAIPVLEKIIESYGTRRAKEVALYQHRLGQAYEGLGEHEEALKRYDAAFKIDLTSVPILRDLGRVCLQKGDLDRAQKTYRALLLQKLAPDAGIQKADVYYRLGEISLRQGDKVKAKAMLERAIAEAGQHAEARAMLDQL